MTSFFQRAGGWCEPVESFIIYSLPRLSSEHRPLHHATAADLYGDSVSRQLRFVPVNGHHFCPSAYASDGRSQ